MKKVKFSIPLAILVILAVSAVDVKAQEFKSGSVLISTGLSFGYYDAFTYDYTGIPIGLGANVEFSITEDIAVGGFLAYTLWNRNWNNGDTYTYHSFDFGVRGSYHFSRLLKLREKRFDPYAGAILGLGVRGSGNDFDPGYDDPYDGVVVQPGIFAGARWFFSDNFAAYGEVGIGLHPITLGISFKL